MEDKGIKITPEMIEKINEVKSSAELMELSKSYEIVLDKITAEKWFKKLNSGEFADNELSSANIGVGCSKVSCPKCGSQDYYQEYFRDVGVYCHCDHCGYEKWYYG